MLPKTRQSLHFRFLVFILAFVVVAMLAGSLTVGTYSYLQLNQTITRGYQNIIRGVADQVRMFMAVSCHELEVLAVLLEIVSAPVENGRSGDDQARHAGDAIAHTEAVLEAFTQVHQHFTVVILDDVRDQAGERGTVPHSAHAWGGDRRFHRIFKGRTLMSEADYDDDRSPFAEVAVPLNRPNRRPQIVKANLALDIVGDLVQKVTIGARGVVSLVDADGRYLSHRDPKAISHKVPPGFFSRLKQIHQNRRVLTWNEPQTNTLYLVTLIPELGWYVVLRQPIGELVGQTYQSLPWIMGAIFLGICLTVALVGWWWMRRLLLPIDELHRQVNLIGSGNLEHQVAVKTGDEIGSLALAFNRMAARLKDLIENKIKTTRELEHAKHMAVLGEASSVVTHEVNNLVNNTRLVLNILKKQTLSEKSINLLELLESDMGRLLEFSADFLQFARKPQLELALLNPVPIIEDVLVAQNEAAKSKGITIRTHWAENLQEVPLDTTSLHQVVGNLLKNAIDALSGWDRERSILIRGDVAEGFFRLIVSDTGPGIKETIRADIFRPFYSTKGKKGTGLGLAIVSDIIRAHGGRIEYRAPADGGSEFRLYFPLDSTPAESPAAEPALAPAMLYGETDR